MGLAEYGAAAAATERLERRISDLIIDLAPMRVATNLPDLFAGLARSTINAINADACLVSLLDDDRRILRDVAASVVPPAKLNTVAEEYFLDDFPVTERTIRNRDHVQLSLSDAHIEEAERKILEDFGFARVLICGFSIGTELKGTVEAYRLSDRPFRSDDPEHIKLLVEFAANGYSRIQMAEKLEMHYIETIEALASALEARDPYTQAHTGRIRELSMGVALSLRIPSDERQAVHLGSLLHDVGKIGISDSILQKNGPLSDDEWATMRRHPEIGERMLRGIDFLRPALPVVRHHHERWDGKGYPDGLKGNEIPLPARIVSACDAFDAMTTDRPYREALSVGYALEEIDRVAGSQLDPLCATLLIEVVSSVGTDNVEERFVRYAS